MYCFKKYNLQVVKYHSQILFDKRKENLLKVLGFFFFQMIENNEKQGKNGIK